MRLRPIFKNSRTNPEKRLRKQELKVARTSSIINQDLRSKIEEIEDLESIRKLKAAYCDACDDDHNGDSVSALFTKGGTWQQVGQTEQADSRVCVGRKEIAAFMYGLRDAGFIVRSSHIVTNPVIDISGTSASGKWKFLMLYTHTDGTFHRIIGQYEDTYEKVRDDWYFESLKAIVEENSIYLTENPND
tara:strand:- start:395 stop:961 length:567 start_codon:yes stop_codon:yes gene_type:complete